VKQAAKLKSSTWNSETVVIGFTAVLRWERRDRKLYNPLAPEENAWLFDISD